MTMEKKEMETLEYAADAYVGKDDGGGPNAQIEEDTLELAADAYVGKDDGGGPNAQIEDDVLEDAE